MCGVGRHAQLVSQAANAALLAAMVHLCCCAPHERARVAAGCPYSAGAWAEMQFDTESGYADLSGNATDQRAQVRAMLPLPARGAAPRPTDACACAQSALLCDACPDVAASLLIASARSASATCGRIKAWAWPTWPVSPDASASRRWVWLAAAVRCARRRSPFAWELRFVLTVPWAVAWRPVLLAAE